MTGHTTGGIWMCYFMAQVQPAGWWEGGNRCPAAHTSYGWVQAAAPLVLCGSASCGFTSTAAHLFAPTSLQVPLIVAERVFLAVLRKAGITLPNPLRIVLTIACQNQVGAG